MLYFILEQYNFVTFPTHSIRQTDTTVSRSAMEI